MWNVNKEHIQRVKEELQARHAAMLARYKSEVKSVEDDLNEIEELERIAYAFAAKHIPELDEPMEVSPEPIAVLEAWPEESLVDAAVNHVPRRDEVITQADPEAALELEATSEPSVQELLKRPVDADRLSLWRARRSPDVGQ